MPVEDKYLKERKRIVKLNWNKLSEESRDAIKKLEKEFKGVNRLSELLDEIVESVYEDGFLTGRGL